MGPCPGEPGRAPPQGDELIAFNAASELHDRLGLRFPVATADATPEEYVEALNAWRAKVDPLVAEFRRKAVLASKTIQQLRKMISAFSEESLHLNGVCLEFQRALKHAEVCRMYALYAVAFIGHVGDGWHNGNKKARYWLHLACLHLHLKGVNKTKIAKMLRIDVREVRRNLEGWDSDEDLLSGLRHRLGLPDPHGE